LFTSILSLFQEEYRLLSGRQLRFGGRWKAILNLPVSAVLVTALNFTAYQKGFIAQWWHVIGFTCAFFISIILPSMWMFTCAVIIKVANDLADDMEQVREQRIHLTLYDTV
jgi:hypothetical protein